jgi:tRNA(fMet)-specific endonuclease VapC
VLPLPVYLLDTDTCVWMMRGREPVSTRAQTVSPADLAVASMTVAELWYGAIRGMNPKAFDAVRAFLGTGVGILPFDEDAAYQHAEIRNAVRAQPIGPRDMVIASVAVARGLTVVTSNVREFGRVPGLPHVDWMQARS